MNFLEFPATSADVWDVELIHQAISSAAPPKQPTLEGGRGESNEYLARLCNLPPLNSIANQVLSLSADADASIDEISDVMRSDPALAADVLLLANSPLFGFRSKIQLIRHAIAMLGIDRIKTIAFTAAMRAFVGTGGGWFVRPCWLHSVASAIIAEEIAPQFGLRGDVAYPLLLLHDIGRLGLLKSNEGEYTELLTGRFDSPEDLLAAETALFKVDHALAGSWLVKTWGYPPAFSRACEQHHAPFSEDDSDLLRLTKVSCRIAETLGFAAISYPKGSSYRELIDSLPPAVQHKEFPPGAEMAAMVESRLKGFD